MAYFIPHSSYKSLTWPEVVSIIVLIAGFIFSFYAKSAMMYYIIAFLAGIFFGRLWYNTRKTLQFKYFMIISFFMIGFVVGSLFTPYGNPKVTPFLTLFIYLIGIIGSYYIHIKGYIKAIDF
ncbi:MAG: hypothetical protein ACMXYG_07025 [Candidatus Woesearchaeota archaeon]